MGNNFTETLRASDIPNPAPDTSWILAAKELVLKGYVLAFKAEGINDSCISLRAVHEEEESVLIGFWEKEKCPIRFSWLEKV